MGRTDLPLLRELRFSIVQIGGDCALCWVEDQPVCAIEDVGERGGTQRFEPVLQIRICKACAQSILEAFA